MSHMSDCLFLQKATVKAGGKLFWGKILKLNWLQHEVGTPPKTLQSNDIAVESETHAEWEKEVDVSKQVQG